MSSLVRISDAASLALHAAAVLATAGGRMRTREMAARLRASEAHLAKVLGRLERAGIVKGRRGPAGGFVLARPPSEVTLGEVYAAIEGPVGGARCLLGVPVCDGRCILGGLVREVDSRVGAAFGRTSLADAARAFEGGGSRAGAAGRTRAGRRASMSRKRSRREGRRRCPPERS